MTTFAERYPESAKYLDSLIRCANCNTLIHPSNQAEHDRFCFGNPKRERTGQYEPQEPTNE